MSDRPTAPTDPATGNGKKYTSLPRTPTESNEFLLPPHRYVSYYTRGLVFVRLATHLQEENTRNDKTVAKQRTPKRLLCPALKHLLPYAASPAWGTTRSRFRISSLPVVFRRFRIGATGRVG